MRTLASVLWCRMLFGYLLMGGVVIAVVMRDTPKGLYWETPLPALGFVFWPLVLPFVAGHWVVERFNRPRLPVARQVK